jgi:hypothetical protein
MQDLSGFPKELFPDNLPVSSYSRGIPGQYAFDRINKLLFRCVAPDYWVRYAVAEFGQRLLTYVSDGDINGLFYYAGTAFGLLPWVNPATAGFVAMLRNNNGANTIAETVDRSAVLDTYQNNVAGNYMAVDLGATRSLILTKYSLRNRASDASRPVRNWKMQGINVLTAWSDAAITGATWIDIDSRVSDTTMPATLGVWTTYTVPSVPAPYRYIRFLQTGVNGGGDNFNTLNEWELYGILNF